MQLKSNNQPNPEQYHDGRESQPLYRKYLSMKGRCYTKTHPSYKNYGGKGVKVCDKWLDKENGFWQFVGDMGEQPRGHTLDRIDPNGDYTPDNCRWANDYLQSQNKRKMNNRLGYHGIRVKRGRYQPYYNHKGSLLSLGTYDSIEEAIEVRKRLEKSLDPHKESERIRKEFKIISRMRRGGWRTPNGKWAIAISVDGKKYTIGTFNSQKKAIAERDKWITQNLKKLLATT